MRVDIEDYDAVSAVHEDHHNSEDESDELDLEGDEEYMLSDADNDDDGDNDEDEDDSGDFESEDNEQISRGINISTLTPRFCIDAELLGMLLDMAGALLRTVALRSGGRGKRAVAYFAGVADSQRFLGLVSSDSKRSSASFTYSDRSTFPSFRERIDDIVPSLMHVYSLAYCAMLAPDWMSKLDIPSTSAVMIMSQRSYDILTGRVDVEQGGLTSSRNNGIRDICLRNSRYFYTEYLQRLAVADMVVTEDGPGQRNKRAQSSYVRKLPSLIEVRGAWVSRHFGFQLLLGGDGEALSTGVGIPNSYRKWRRVMPEGPTDSYFYSIHGRELVDSFVCRVDARNVRRDGWLCVRLILDEWLTAFSQLTAKDCTRTGIIGSSAKGLKALSSPMVARNSSIPLSRAQVLVHSARQPPPMSPRFKTPLAMPMTEPIGLTQSSAAGQPRAASSANSSPLPTLPKTNISTPMSPPGLFNSAKQGGLTSLPDLSDGDRIFTVTVLGQLCHSVALGFRDGTSENSIRRWRSKAQLCAELVDWMDPESSATLIQESLRTIRRGFEDFIHRVSNILQSLSAGMHRDNIFGENAGDSSATVSAAAKRSVASSSFRARPMTARRDAVLIELLIIYMPSYHQERLPQITVDITLSCGDELMRCVPLWKNLAKIGKSGRGEAEQHLEERLSSTRASLANATASRLRVITGAAPMLHLPFSSLHGHVEDILTNGHFQEEQNGHHCDYQQHHHRHHHQQHQHFRKASSADPSFLVFYAAWVESLMRHLVDLVWITRGTRTEAWCVDALRLLINARGQVKAKQAARAREDGNESSLHESVARLPQLPIEEVSELQCRDEALHARVLGVLPECRDTAEMGAGWGVGIQEILG